jgi:crotonobetainyl-CoA:carnitine CoA-transferase CaiB-like acyl-CoA transferase
MGSGISSIAPYQAFPTTDGYVMIAAGNDALFGRLCAALDLPEVASDGRFRTNPERVAHRGELTPLLEARTHTLTTAQLLERGQAHAVPCSAIHSIAEVVEDKQVLASEMIPSAPTDEMPDYREVALPLRIDGRRPRAPARPPGSGEHTREVLGGLGYGDDEIDALIAGGVAGEE